MSDKKLYLLAVFDAETQKTLAGYYDILAQRGFVGEQTKNIPYHFTLGTAGLDREEELIRAMNKICVETNIIEICLAHVGLFGMNVLFIAPNMNFELMKLQNSFFGECGYGCHPWSAHATLLMDEPENILKAIPIAAENFRPVKARIESVALYEFFPARLIKECRLK